MALVELTFERAKMLRYGDMLYSNIHKNADGTPQRWKVNGEVKTWKKDPKRIRIPVKNGLRNYDAVNEHCFDERGICTILCVEENF